MASEAPRKATYEDVLNAPEHMVAEVIAGVLYTQPRPRMGHARTAGGLAFELGGPFDRGKGGPGGWIILPEPELHLGSDILVPDLASWRRSTMPELNLEAAYSSVRPDWVCEILSPSTARKDRVLKMPIYRSEGVAHVWLIDPTAKTLEVYKLAGDRYLLLDSYAEDARVRAEPFDAVELELGALWAS
jgi:Uma2 family endonuclease